MKRIQFILSVALLMVLFSSVVAAKGQNKPQYKEDICEVIAYSSGDFKNELAQYINIPRNDGVSKPCLDFAKLDSTAAAVCGTGGGEIRIYQITWAMPGTTDLSEHCHYKCFGNPDGPCEDSCNRSPAQIPTNIGTLPCPSL